jgi:hypothetical protein
MGLVVSLLQAAHVLRTATNPDKMCCGVLCAGLVEQQREGVLDSFIGWAKFAEQHDRQKLLQLCVHGLALHCAAAQSR